MIRLPGRLGRTRVVLFFAAFLLYAPGFWWGAPVASAADRTDAWGVDDEPPLGPLAQADDIVHPKAEMNPNLGYPMLHPFMVLTAFTPYIGYLFATGGLHHPTVAYPHGFTDPVTALRVLSWIAHLLSVLLAAGIVVCAWETGRVLWDERSGYAAAAGALLFYPMFYYARVSNVDVPVLFFIAAALAAFAHILARGLTFRRAVTFGTLAGLAVATKEPAFASLVFAPLVLLVLPDPGQAGAPWRRGSFWLMALTISGCALGAYALGSGMLVDPDRWVAHMRFASGRIQADQTGGVPWLRNYPSTLDGNLAYAWALLGICARAITWPGLLLGMAGVVVAARRAPRTALLALSAAGYLVILFLSARVVQLRYVMPAAFVLAIFAGHAAAVAWFSGRIAARVTGLILAAAAGLTLAAWNADLTWAMLHDSRYAAGAWVARTARPGDALEYFGSPYKHPPMPASLSSRWAIPYRGSMFRADTSDVAVGAIVEGWASRRPRFIELVPDYTSSPGAPYASSCPPAIYRGLEDGSLGYRLVAQFHHPALLPWADRPPIDYPVVNPPIRFYERSPLLTAPARAPS